MGMAAAISIHVLSQNTPPVAGEFEPRGGLRRPSSSMFIQRRQSNTDGTRFTTDF